MATMLEMYTTEEQHSVVRFLWAKDPMQGIFIKKCFLFTVGSVSYKAVRSWVEKFSQGRSKVADNARPGRPGAEVAETTAKRILFCMFHGKAMGQVYKCWCRIYREINVFPRFEYHTFYVLYPFVTYLLTLPRILLPVFLFSVVFQNPDFDDIGYVTNTMTNSRSCIRWSIA
jgi:hypothetical protein